MAILRIKDEAGNTISIPAIKGEPGKSAYEYAKDGGYTGTEEEFKAKLAQENPTREEFSQLQDTKVELPKDADGNTQNGEVGQFAISDGKGGITWSDKEENESTTSEITPLPLLADFTVEEDVVNVDIPLSSTAKRRILVYTELPSEKTLNGAYPRYNGWLVDMTLSDMKAGSKRWLECVLMDGGYSRWIWGSARTSAWDGSPDAVCNNGVLMNRNGNSEINSFGYGIVTVPAGTRIRVWGE